MGFFFYNTDADSLTRRGRYPVLIKQMFAATSGPRTYGEQLRQLSPTDVLFMYENGVGVVAVGTVIEHWDEVTQKPPKYYQPGDDGFDHEYRIKVKWFLDLSSCPVRIDELRDKTGYTPRGTIRRIVKRQNEIEDLIEERKAAIARTETNRRTKR